MEHATVQVRQATRDDEAAVGDLAGELATSFPFSPERFHDSYVALLSTDHACLLAATVDGEVVGYLLGFAHATFFANGSVAWVEEILVRSALRRQGAGSALMRVFEDWAADRGCVLVALATRRAAQFYDALGYEQSAAYFRKALSVSRGDGGGRRRVPGGRGPCGP